MINITSDRFVGFMVEFFFCRHTQCWTFLAYLSCCCCSLRYQAMVLASFSSAPDQPCINVCRHVFAADSTTADQTHALHDGGRNSILYKSLGKLRGPGFLSLTDFVTLHGPFSLKITILVFWRLHHKANVIREFVTAWREKLTIPPGVGGGAYFVSVMVRSPPPPPVPEIQRLLEIAWLQFLPLSRFDILEVFP